MKLLNNKKVLVILIVAIFIIFISILIVTNRVKTPTSINDFKNARQVIEYMGSEYKGEKNAANKVIYFKSKYMLYNEDGTSNENYFSQMINMIATVIKYQSFNLYDNENSIKIVVKCDKESESINSVSINNLTDYFSSENTYNAINEYKKIDEINIDVNSNVLRNAINNNWGYSENIFGTKTSQYSGYNIFFDEGIEVKTVVNGIEEGATESIFNIVFTNKNTDNIVAGLNTSDTLSTVISTIGNPQFGSEESGLIGYKTKEFYVFFNLKNEISIYPNITANTLEFASSVTSFLKTKNSDRLLENVFHAWPQYNEFVQNSDPTSYKLTYALYGVRINFNTDTHNQGVVLYNNFKGNITEDVTFDDIINKNKEIPDNVYFVNEDLVYEAEQGRTFYSVDTQFMEQGESYIFYPVNQGNYYTLRFISKSENKPNTELDETVYTYKFVDDSKIIYSIQNKGIYVFNALTGYKYAAIEGVDDFRINGYENGVLTYDGDKKINI